jgi:hypothetical protein
MSNNAAPRVGVRVWAQPYAVAQLRALPESWPPRTADEAPTALVTARGEVSLLAPEALLAAVAPLVEHVSTGWSALTLDAVFPLDVVGVLAVVSGALADLGVPVMAFASHDTDHFLVPTATVGRVLAALASSRLERFLPQS